MKKTVLMLLLLVLLSASGADSVCANTLASAEKVSGGTWKKDKTGYRYTKADGTYIKKKWIKVSSKIYYVNSSGYRMTGWFQVSKKTYFATSKGVVYVKKWLSKDSKKYYLQSNGTRASSKWLKIGSATYYFQSDGSMASNQFVNDSYVAKNGKRLEAVWVRMTDGSMYYFNAKGKMLKSIWLKSNGKYYYMKSDGTMAVSQWIKSGNYWYYVDNKGVRLQDCIVDGYYLDNKGRRTVKVFSGEYILAGDSRTIGMEISMQSQKNESIFIGKIGEGYDWLTSEGSAQLESYLKENPHVKVIFAFGVNDLGNLSNYLSWYKNYLLSHLETDFYFLSVNPVIDGQAGPITNEWISNFNQQLKNAFPEKYIDSFTYLTEEGFGSADGIHYSVETYQRLYNFIIETLVRMG